jgi:hypothetical protein
VTTLRMLESDFMQDVTRRLAIVCVRPPVSQQQS